MGFYVLGFNTDTWDSIAATIEYAISLGSTLAQFKLLTPYPGTPLCKQMERQVFEKDWERFDGFTPTFHHPNLSPAGAAVPPRRGLRAASTCGRRSSRTTGGFQKQWLLDAGGAARREGGRRMHALQGGRAVDVAGGGMLSAISRYGARFVPELDDDRGGAAARRAPWCDGREIAAFEDAFAQRLGGGRAVTTSYGRMAAYYILKALDLPPGSEVVFPPSPSGSCRRWRGPPGSSRSSRTWTL